MRAIKGMTTALLVTLLAGCAELDVVNENNPDTDRLLTEAADVENLIGSAYLDLYNARHWYNGAPLALSNLADEHTTNVGNAMQLDLYREPKAALQNTPSYIDKEHIEFVWDRSYRAIKAAYDGLVQIEEGLEIIDDQGVNQTARARAFGKFIQGTALGTVAQLYDRAFILDETVSTEDIAAGLELQDYATAMAKAIEYLEDGIAVAESSTFTIPNGWIPTPGGTGISSAEFARIMHSTIARFLATVARTPAERAAVNWSSVQQHADAGITTDFEVMNDDNFVWWSDMTYYTTAPVWGYWDNRFLARADTTGNAQEWLDTPVLQRTAVLIASPDQRFPGSTEAGAMGDYVWHYEADFSPACCRRPDRGEYNWSYYVDRRPKIYEFVTTYQGGLPEISVVEMNMLKAEALLRANQNAAAADLINISRVAKGGLPPVTAAGVPGGPASCVPRNEEGGCGDLWEAMKWEKRVENYEYTIGDWFYDSRGWGDLVEGSLIMFPIPATELQVLQEPIYTFGGVGGDCAVGSSCSALAGGN